MPPSRGGDKGDVPVRAILDTAVRAALHAVLPARCAGCGVIADADHRFCAGCWASLQFLGPPCCAACHVPFSHDRGNGSVCASCAADPPRHAGVRAAVAYGPVARHLALRLKYARRTALADTAARLMARWIPADAALLVPVPLHRWRLWSRGFNQAALIAAALARQAGVPSDPLLLRRIRATPVLRGLGGRGRARAVAGAFTVDPARADAIRGRTIVLVDDVYTSGATTDACVRALRRAGAARVVILCWARVLDEALD